MTSLDSMDFRKDRDFLFNNPLFSSHRQSARESKNISEQSISHFLKNDMPEVRMSGGQRISSECMMLVDSYHDRYKKNHLLFSSKDSNQEMSGQFNRLSKDQQHYVEILNNSILINENYYSPSKMDYPHLQYE